MNILKWVSIMGAVAFTFNAQAYFVIDYQGLDKEPAPVVIPQSVAKIEPKPVPATVTKPVNKITMPQTVSHPIHMIGNGKASIRRGYALQLRMHDSISSITPKHWNTYYDASINFNEKIDWDGDLPWTSILSNIANEYKLSFIIDWDQKLVQVIPAYPVVNKANFDITLVTNPMTGMPIRIYKHVSLSDRGLLVVLDKMYPITTN